jgi:ABC-type multidrug transport system ATPase subunit
MPASRKPISEVSRDPDVQIENVSVAYGKVEAVRNVSLSVEQGRS